jgi:hypothetical protein
MTDEFKNKILEKINLVLENIYDYAILTSPFILAYLFYKNIESIYSTIAGLFIGFFLINYKFISSRSEKEIRELKNSSISKPNFEEIKCFDIQIELHLTKSFFKEQLMSYFNINDEECENIYYKYENETNTDLVLNSISLNSSEIRILIMHIPIINLNRISYTNLKRGNLGKFYIKLNQFNKFVLFLIKELKKDYVGDIDSYITLDHEDDSIEIMLSFLEERKTIYGFNISKLINLIKFYDKNLYDEKYHNKDIKILNKILKKYKLKIIPPFEYEVASKDIELKNSNYKAYISYRIENG